MIVQPLCCSSVGARYLMTSSVDVCQYAVCVDDIHAGYLTTKLLANDVNSLALRAPL